MSKPDEWDVIVPPTTLRMDGVTYRVPQTLDIGHSFFLPVLDARRAVGKVRSHYRPQGATLVYDERIEQGMFGIRVWRVA